MDHVLWCIGHELVLPDIVRAEGCYLYDRTGKKYIDMESGVWCTPLGHAHPRLNKAIRTQIDRITHTGYCYSHAIVEEAASEITDISGWNRGRCVFLSSGSEAVEFGIQVLRTLSVNPLLLTLSDSFLGSYGSASQARGDEWSLVDWQACRSCPRAGECDPNCPVLLDIPFDKIGGFVFEPGSASGLVRFPPKPFIQNIVARIREEEGLVQVNEITTGLGRTGKWFGFQHYDIRPDVVSMGKGLGNGYPVSVVAMSPTVIDRLSHISFFSRSLTKTIHLGV